MNDVKFVPDEYLRSLRRFVLVDELRVKFLANRQIAVSKSDHAKMLALNILINKLPNMSENMLLRVIESLARAGEIDMQTIFGMSTHKRPLFSLSLSQFIGTQSPQQSLLAPSAAQSTPGDNPIYTSRRTSGSNGTYTKFLKQKRLRKYHRLFSEEPGKSRIGIDDIGPAAAAGARIAPPARPPPQRER
jgi:hypothetical protein